MPIRFATLNDLPALLDLEQRCFATNRLSRRALRYHLNSANSMILLDDMKGVIRGSLLMFRHPRSRLARIYSLGVDPDYRKQGIAESLLMEAEARSGKQGLKLELRADNDPAFRLYTKLGYLPRKEFVNFYEDGCTAIEMVKEVAARH